MGKNITIENQDSKSQEKNRNAFKNYNQMSFDIEKLQEIIKLNKFKDLDDKTQEKLRITLEEKLCFKMYIDAEVFNRKKTIQKNADSYIKLKKDKEDAKASYEAYVLNQFGTNANFRAEEDPEIKEFTNFVKELISYINSHRLDGVWSRALINTLLGLGLMVSVTLVALSKAVAIINGFASYLMYYLRGGLELGKMVKHTFSHHQFYEDNDISALDIATVQLGQRYTTIINDLVLWGPVNMVTFHWWTDLRGAEQGNKGDWLTLGLLCADLTLTLFRLWHEYSKFNTFKEELSSIILDAAKRDDIINELEEKQKKTIVELWLTIGYQVFLIGSFATMTVISKALAGSIACFALQILFTLKDLFVKLATTDNSEQRYRELVKSLSHIFIQVLIPGMFICYSMLLAPTLPFTLPAFFVTAALIAISSLCIKCVNSYNLYKDAQWALDDFKKNPEAPEEEKQQLEDNLEKAWKNFTPFGYTLSGIASIASLAVLLTSVSTWPLIIAALSLVVSIYMIRLLYKNKDTNDASDDKTDTSDGAPLLSSR